jgi:hypothetical protein
MCGRLKTPAIGHSLAARIRPPPRTVFTKLLTIGTTTNNNTTQLMLFCIYNTISVLVEYTHTAKY